MTDLKVTVVLGVERHGGGVLVEEGDTGGANSLRGAALGFWGRLSLWSVCVCVKLASVWKSPLGHIPRTEVDSGGGDIFHTYIRCIHYPTFIFTLQYNTLALTQWPKPPH